MYWRNMGKFWQDGETSSRRNDVLRQAQQPTIFQRIPARESGGKDSGVKAGKNSFLLAFSGGTVHTPLKINEYDSYALSQLKKLSGGQKQIFFGLNTAVRDTES